MSIRRWVMKGAAACAVAALFGGSAVAPAQDFPTYKGDNQRSGKTSDPNNNGPGPALLTWFRPNLSDNAGRRITLDNADLPNPNTDPPYTSKTGTWLTPAIPEEAGNPFLPPVDNAPPGVTRNPNSPAYEYAEAIASALGNDPRVPLNAGDTLSIFTWTLRNYTAPFQEARNYAIYVWLPVGPTVVAGADRFPQRHFVYEVLAPGSPPWIEVLDIERSGGGWVRLGGGGLPTNKLFTSDGITPIQVRLYNTVPRDPSTGKLTTNPAGTGNDLDLTKPRPLVYADAVMAVPHIGRYAATPIVGGFQGAASFQIRTVAALNVDLPGDRGALMEMDNTSSGVSAGPGWTTSTLAANYKGTNYHNATITNAIASATSVAYTLYAADTGDYDVYAWLPGSSGGQVFGSAVEYRIYEGSTLTSTTADQNAGGGWVRLASRKFRHSTAPGQQLRVEVTNYSGNAADAGLLSLADTIGFSFGASAATTKGAVTSYDHNTGNPRWRFSPLEEGEFAFNMDNLSSGVTRNGPDWVSSTLAANYRGSDYFDAPINASLATASTVTYDPGHPNLETGTYDIYAWLPGNSNGQDFAHNLVYEVHEGATVTSFTVDQSLARGWVRIGTRRFSHSSAALLRLVVTNHSADPTDAPRRAFTDAVRFIGSSSLAIASTPVQATVRIRMTRGGAPVDRGVVVTAGENGRLYCLDGEGRGDGSTDVLWTYPSTPDPDVTPWKDPNLNPPDATNTDWAEIDGTAGQLIAEMPSGFNLSSALIERIGGEDYLFIAGSNGRVYCIEMAGRGDMNLTARKPGTTRRQWSYPDDFPAVRKPSNLGAFVSSVAFANTGPGPTLFVPTEQGRLFALDAVGTPATRTTTERWVYPLLTRPNLGPITTTPAIEFGRIYFGTSSRDGATPGEFLALNADNGALVWSLTGTAKALDDFNGSPTTVSSIILGGGMPDTVFVGNDNRGVYALDAATGAILWETTELEAPARAPLTYAFMNVVDNGGVANDRPVIVVPRSDGVISMLSARTADLTLNGNRRARGDFITESPSLTAGVAIGRGFMYYGDNAGYLYARSSVAGVFPPGEDIPGSEGVGENDPDYDAYKDANVKLIKRSAYNLLRQGSMYYNDAMDPNNEIARSPMAFEWGETIYMLVYNFPYKRGGPSALPPTVNITLSMQGATIRNVYMEARKFPGLSAGVPLTDDDPRSGYAILSFPIQSASSSALPPGPGEISLGFIFNQTSGGQVTFSSAVKKPFFIANPLALVIPSPVGPLQSIGNTPVTSDPQNLVNGSGPVPNLRSTAGTTVHGQTANTQVSVIDRSLTVFQRGGVRGLPHVRLSRLDLAWQFPASPLAAAPGQGLVLKPLDALLFPGFEDNPLGIPNISLDYGNIGRHNVRVTKSLLEVAEDPVTFAVELLPPTQADGSPVTEANAASRVLRSNAFDIDVAVPRFQPPNESRRPDANAGGNSALYVPAGYGDIFTVYVDSTGNGVFDRGGGWDAGADGVNPSNTREAFRSFAFGLSVPPDHRISVQTPTIDLGSIAAGAGYTPELPGPANAAFDPWTGTYVDLFKPALVAPAHELVVVNEGNVNMLNLRLAKATTTDGTTFNPWQIPSRANEDLAYLSGDWDLWSDLDPAYAPTRVLAGSNSAVILQKARVGDRAPRRLTTVPIRRANPNFGYATDEPMALINPTTGQPFPVGDPRVGVTLPFGFPVGTYSQLLRIIEDDVPGNHPATMAMNLDPNGVPTEPYTDPTVRIIFRARESRMTGSHSNLTAPMVDPLSGDTAAFRRSNRQPAGARNPENGSLVVAWASDRNDWNNLSEPTTITNPLYRIYVASVAGANPNSVAGPYPLKDLHQFAPDTAAGRWFIRSPQTANGFPSSPLDQLFDLSAGQSVINSTARFGSPSFPGQGMLDPFRDVTIAPTPFGHALMAFVGEAQVQTATGRLGQSKIFLVPVTVAADGTVNLRSIGGSELIQVMTNDPLASKGKPSVVQTTTGAIVFYSATVGGRSSIYWTHFNGDVGTPSYDGSKFSESQAIDLGQGFESIYSPLVTGRRYKGEGAGAGGDSILEMTFAGKLRARPNAEVFYARLSTTAGTGGELIPDALTVLPVRTKERLTQAGEAGVYRADGVLWDTRSVVTLELIRGGVATNLQSGTATVERTTGIITFPTLLGGTAYLDPSMGTVRLANASVPRDGTLALTYRPRVLRVSEGTVSGFVSPNVGFDERLVPDVSYWSNPDNVSAPAITDPVRPGRWMFLYNRAAAGAGQAARPFVKTMRLGVELPFPIFTNDDGTIPNNGFRVYRAGTTNPINSYYQMDPGKGKVYFTPADENLLVDIEYTAANPATGQSIGTRTLNNVSIGMIVERAEEAVPLDEAVNEMNVSMFLDPFETAGAGVRRPGLIWLLWSSTRAGAPDLFLQTMAPRFTPLHEARAP